MAREKGCSAIYDSKRRRNIEDNVGAVQVRLDAEDLERFDRILPPSAAAGERYDAADAALNW